MFYFSQVCFLLFEKKEKVSLIKKFKKKCFLTVFFFSSEFNSKQHKEHIENLFFLGNYGGGGGKQLRISGMLSIIVILFA